jgi:hypothetical protein
MQMQHLFFRQATSRNEAEVSRQRDEEKVS